MTRDFGTKPKVSTRGRVKPAQSARYRSNPNRLLPNGILGFRRYSLENRLSGLTVSGRVKIEEKLVQSRHLRIIFSALTLFNAVLMTSGAQASGSWQPLEIIDMTTSHSADADVVVSTGFFDEMDFVSLDEPILSIASDGIKFDTKAPKTRGWSSLVEVELTEEPTLQFGEASSFANTLASIENETKVQGFYSMRYQFSGDTRFRPYAGAGFGLVAKGTETEASGTLAGRATAGFDLTLGEGSALFAEYAVLKNGGVNVGSSGAEDSSGAIADDIEHSVKLGFRRSF